MRILLSAFACGPGEGSEPGIGWNWALQAAALGHEVVTLTDTTSREQIESAVREGRLPPTLRFEFFMPGWLAALRRAGWRLGSQSLVEHFTHFVWQYVAYRHARRHFDVSRFDCVHHITYSGIRHPTFMGRLPWPLVLGPVGGGERAPFALRRSLPWRGWFRDLVRDLHTRLLVFDPVTRAACAQALVVYVKTRHSREALPRRFHHKIAIRMEIGIDEVAPPRPERAHDAPLRLLYAGRFIYWKGMHFGLRALATARARGVEVRLTMLGQGPDERWWRGMARDLGVDDAVEWRAWLPHAQMSEFYRAHDALIFPSLHDSSGNAVLEALTHGLPVLCLDLGGPGTIVDDSCGRAVSPAGRDESACIDALADAMIQLEQSPALCHELSEGARRRAQSFRWSEQVNQLYEDVARRLEEGRGTQVREFIGPVAAPGRVAGALQHPSADT